MEDGNNVDWYRKYVLSCFDEKEVELLMNLHGKLELARSNKYQTRMQALEGKRLDELTTEEVGYFEDYKLIAEDCRIYIEIVDGVIKYNKIRF